MLAAELLHFVSDCPMAAIQIAEGLDLKHGENNPLIPNASNLKCTAMFEFTPAMNAALRKRFRTMSTDHLPVMNSL